MSPTLSSSSFGADVADDSDAKMMDIVNVDVNIDDNNNGAITTTATKMDIDDDDSYIDMTNNDEDDMKKPPSPPPIAVAGAATSFVATVAGAVAIPPTAAAASIAASSSPHKREEQQQKVIGDGYFGCLGSMNYSNFSSRNDKQSLSPETIISEIVSKFQDICLSHSFINHISDLGFTNVEFLRNDPRNFEKGQIGYDKFYQCILQEQQQQQETSTHESAAVYDATTSSSSSTSLLSQDSTLGVVFHGTSTHNVSSILSQGLDKRKRRGQAYGNGEYFSKDPCTSVGYCKGGNEMIVFVVVLPKPKCLENTDKLPTGRYHNEPPPDFVIVNNNKHHLAIGTIKFAHVSNDVMRVSRQKRSQFLRLSKEVYEKSIMAKEARLKAQIIQYLISGKVDVASEKYQRGDYGSLMDTSKKEISWYVHSNVDEALIEYYFPNLPQPYATFQELEEAKLLNSDDATKSELKAKQELELAIKKKQQEQQQQSNNNNDEQQEKQQQGGSKGFEEKQLMTTTTPYQQRVERVRQKREKLRQLKKLREQNQQIRTNTTTGGGSNTVGGMVTTTTVMRPGVATPTTTAAADTAGGGGFTFGGALPALWSWRPSLVARPPPTTPAAAAAAAPLATQMIANEQGPRKTSFIESSNNTGPISTTSAARTAAADTTNSPSMTHLHQQQLQLALSSQPSTATTAADSMEPSDVKSSTLLSGLFLKKEENNDHGGDDDEKKENNGDDSSRNNADDTGTTECSTKILQHLFQGQFDVASELYISHESTFSDYCKKEIADYVHRLMKNENDQVLALILFPGLLSMFPFPVDDQPSTEPEAVGGTTTKLQEESSSS